MYKEVGKIIFKISNISHVKYPSLIFGSDICFGPFLCLLSSTGNSERFQKLNGSESRTCHKFIPKKNLLTYNTKHHFHVETSAFSSFLSEFSALSVNKAYDNCGQR